MKLKNQIFLGASNKKSLIDLNIPETYSGKMILFVHGYMGFKDWGCWNLMEDYFLSLGFGFCKYNVSHNGCSIEDTFNFVDLDAFSMNNYSNECKDFNAALNFITKQVQPFPELYVIGHSRGGGVAILQASDPRVKKLATWAAISDIGIRFPKNEELEKWKKEEHYFRQNGRTLQEMPHHFSQYLDFEKNQTELNIRKSAENLKKPWLILHGDADTSVPISEGEELSSWSNRELKIISGANHTFDSAHPWAENEMPEKLKELCQLTAAFFLSKKT